MRKLRRRYLVHAFIGAAVIGMLGIRAAGGVHLGEGERPTHLQNVSIEQALALYQFQDRDVSIHRGANSLSALQDSVSSGADFLDLDAKRIGDRIYVTHARYFGPLLGVDVDSSSLYVGPPRWDLQDVCRELSVSNDQADRATGIMLEPKRGADLVTRILMYRTLQGCGLPFYIESLDWRELDELQAVFGDDERLLYVIATRRAMEQFLAEQPERQRRRTLINPSLVPAYTDDLRATGVEYIMAGTDNPEHALLLLDTYGLDGISTYALDVAQAIKRGPQTFTLAVNGVEALPVAVGELEASQAQ